MTVSPMNDVMWFYKKGKLSHCYVGLYEVLEQIGKVTYRLDLLSEMAMVHPVFHAFILRKFIGDLSFIIPLMNDEVGVNLTY